MYVLLSGEGATDMGLCTDNINACEGDRHLMGPMAIIVLKIVEERFGYSFIEAPYYGFVSESALKNKASSIKSNNKKNLRLPGYKTPQETRYFYNNARVLALCAKEKEEELGDQVVAVLFRDSDGTASADRGRWNAQWNSMIWGFQVEGFERGVPMIPKPKSEAWIICAVKDHPYQNCATLEARSGNDKSPNSLKGELTEILGSKPTREMLCDMVNNGTIDIDKIDMPSFQDFKRELLSKL